MVKSLNERITEDFVRDHFKKDKFFKENKIIIEEQKSKYPRIIKLLKTASKKGKGTGYPEFIISFPNDPFLVVVIECKADVTKHESKERNKFSEYSVDGALLYSSYLAKEFDVISIGVSGQTKKELKISHFLQLKGDKEAKPIFGNDLLSVESYIDGYKQDERKFKQSYDDLLKYSKVLNDFLHSKKVKESDRSLLISGVLIALEDESFKVSYLKQSNPKSLAENLVNTIKQQLSTNITNEKAESLAHQYGFIKIHPTLSKNSAKHDNVLRDLIRDIDENINSFMKTYRYHDVLGQFYIEFLRYANNDKGLGIVLTPPHITELFSDLAFVDKNSIILDNCTGTGGFLISAMQKMIKD
ncbi:MAG: SAM-dependent methyltransferase, partial [Nanoarchaeota archaeon]|nr:SAM-dependent methyltransferase [Nanoarchaeota archaeon]